MRVDKPAVVRFSARELVGVRPATLPSQETLWGWVRAALAFQPAHLPVPSEPPEATPQPLDDVASSVQADSPVAAPPPAAAAPAAAVPEDEVPQSLSDALSVLPYGTRLTARVHPVLVAAKVGAHALDVIGHAHKLSASAANHPALESPFVDEYEMALLDTVDRVLDFSRGIASDNVHEPDAALVANLTRVIGLAQSLEMERLRETMRILEPDANGRPAGHDLAAELVILYEAVTVVVRRVEEAAARILGIDPSGSRGLSRALKDGVLDDFTTADLRDTDLQTANLQGVYWSSWGTRWPPGFDVERLMHISREVDPGSGVFRVEDYTLSNERAMALL